MSITVEGKIERKGFGPGAWAVVSADGKSYELHQAPQELLQAGLQVQIQGDIRKDVMTFAMIGPVLEVKQFEIKS